MDALSGANPTALETLVKKWSEQCPSQVDCPVPGQYDLLGFVDKAQSVGLLLLYHYKSPL